MKSEWASQGSSAVPFDGETYSSPRDGRRLTKQLERVRLLMWDGRWRSLAAISEAVEAPSASVSARIRDLRKPKFGGYTVERRNAGGGVWDYRLTARAPYRRTTSGGRRRR